MRLALSALVSASLAAGLLLAAPAHAADGDVEIVIKDHRFIPDRVEVPAGQKVTLVIKNQDSGPEEFESHDLKREKIVAGGKEIRVVIGPLKPGEYKFFGEYHEATAKGVVVVK